MKRIVSLIIVVLLGTICFVVAPILAFADENDAASERKGTQPSEEQAAWVLRALAERELQGPFELHLLYDHTEEARYVLATSEEGYLIADVLSRIVCEWAEQQSPYVGYESLELYYGGFGQYYCVQENGFYDIRLQESSDSVAYIPTKEELVEAGIIEAIEEGQDSSESAFAPFQLSPKDLPYTKGYVQKLSFGINQDGHRFSSSCTAVATAQALNYLDWTADNSIVPNKYEAEPLTDTRWLSDSQYPQTFAFQSHLIDYCCMGPLPTGRFANDVSTGVADYRRQDTSVASTGISAFWFPSSGAGILLVKSEIDKGLPSMITTVVGEDINGDPMNTHSMLVVGYRGTSDGVELHVHNGWYGSKYISKIGPTYEDDLTYITAIYATFGYSFSFNPGWHKNRRGEWHYYNSDGTYKTDWQKISGDWYYLGSDGVARFGWQTINGSRYYLDPAGESGRMFTGWHNISNANYYFEKGDCGWMLSGWQKIEDYYYYLEPQQGANFGKRQDNQWIPPNRTGNTCKYWAYVGSGGKAAVGLNELPDYSGNTKSYYYFNDSANMQVGWHKASGYWRYFEPQGDNGRMQKTQWISPNRTGNTCKYWAYVNSSGYGAVGWNELPDYTGTNKSYYYFNDSANMQTGWLYYDGSWFYLGEVNDGKTRFGWQTIGGNRHFFKEGNSGRALIGWQYLYDSNGYYWFYLVPEDKGRMVKNRAVPDDNILGLGKYRFLQANNGRAAKSTQVSVPELGGNRLVDLEGYLQLTGNDAGNIRAYRISHPL